MRLLKECPSCKKAIVIVDSWSLETYSVTYVEIHSQLISDTKVSKQTIEFYRCGHFGIKESFSIRDKKISLNSINSEKKAYEYQIDGIDFIDKTSYNALIGDEMGLGKTVQANLALKVAGKFFHAPLIIVKGSTTWQWLKEHKEWTNSLPLGIFMIQGSKSFIPAGFSCYLISMDTFSRMVETKGKDINIYPQLRDLNVDIVIVDEVQCFKNPESKRSKALVSFIKEMNIEHKIFLSGTPIKNRADEYFTVLNLLDPENFSSLSSFRYNWLEVDNDGKYSKIKSWRLEEFHKLIEKYVLRRRKRDVQKWLPPFRRTFESVTIEDENLKAIYNKELAKLQNEMDSKASLSYFEIQENLMTLRRITGMAKVDWAFDEVLEFLESTEDDKIAIGVHHELVRETLREKLMQRGIKIITISGADNDRRKFEKVEEFKRSDRRVLIIGILAGGVGIDGLQCCHEILSLERMWNSPDEEQFEARFDRNGQQFPVSCRYANVAGSIDEYFSARVERIRGIIGETLEVNWNDPANKIDWKELMEETLRHKL